MTPACPGSKRRGCYASRRYGRSLILHTYYAHIAWKREQNASFTDQKYSRRHEWSFDEGVRVPASASPLHVQLPYSSADAVDPEEALVAAASSCHMLFFLFFAAKRGFVVDEYIDEADGVMGKNVEGRNAITRITLRPRVVFSGEKRPSEEDVQELHERSHHECYIANSLKTEIVVSGTTETRP